MVKKKGASKEIIKKLVSGQKKISLVEITITNTLPHTFTLEMVQNKLH